MAHDLARSEFAQRLHAVGSDLDDPACRRIVLCYARRYQDMYWFDNLERSFTVLAGIDGDAARLGDDRAGVLADVEAAMAEYCVSLNRGRRRPASPPGWDAAAARGGAFMRRSYLGRV